MSYILVEDQAGKSATSTFKKTFLKKASGMPKCLFIQYIHTLTHISALNGYRHVSQCVCLCMFVLCTEYCICGMISLADLNSEMGW